MPEAFNPRDGTRISFDDVGEGPALLLAHGSGLSRAMWRGLGYVRALREEFRVLAVDLRGHGRSGKPHDPRSYRMPVLLDDILAVLDWANVPTAHYFGYSLGARIGFSLIDSAPDRITSFVSAGGTYRALGSSIDEIFYPGYDQGLAGGMPVFLERWNSTREVPVDAQTELAFLNNDAQALRAFMAESSTDQGLSETRLLELGTRTMLLAGTADLNRYRDSEHASRLMPDARFVPLAGRDHGDTLRDPELILGSVVPFLRGAS